MRQLREARPLGLAAKGRASIERRAVSNSPGCHSSTAEPVVLSVPKRGRACLVAKVVPLDGEPVLGMVNREQRGVQSVLSVPTVAMEYAERAGCRWFYFRRDRTAEMWRIPLADLRQVGWLKTSFGLAEWFCPIAKMQPTPWRPWAYAEKVVHLDCLAPQEREPEQLEMFGGGCDGGGGRDKNQPVGSPSRLARGMGTDPFVLAR